MLQVYFLQFYACYHGGCALGSEHCLNVADLLAWTHSVREKFWCALSYYAHFAAAQTQTQQRICFPFNWPAIYSVAFTFVTSAAFPLETAKKGLSGYFEGLFFREFVWFWKTVNHKSSGYHEVSPWQLSQEHFYSSVKFRFYDEMFDLPSMFSHFQHKVV